MGADAPTYEESRAAYVAKALKTSPFKVLRAMREWRDLSTKAKAEHRMPKTAESKFIDGLDDWR